MNYPYEGYLGRVKVLNAKQTVSLGEGEIIARDPDGMPKILLDNGDTVYGYESWWTPVTELDGYGVLNRFDTIQ